MKPLKSMKKTRPKWKLSDISNGDYILLGRVTKNKVLMSTLPLNVDLSVARRKEQKKCYIHLPSQTRKKSAASFGFKKKKQNIVINDDHGGTDRVYKIAMRKGTTSHPFRVDCEKTCPTMSIEK